MNCSCCSSNMFQHIPSPQLGLMDFPTLDNPQDVLSSTAAQQDLLSPSFSQTSLNHKKVMIPLCNFYYSTTFKADHHHHHQEHCRAWTGPKQIIVQFCTSCMHDSNVTKSLLHMDQSMIKTTCVFKRFLMSLTKNLHSCTVLLLQKYYYYTSTTTTEVLLVLLL